jgi:hypothetical protein
MLFIEDLFVPGLVCHQHLSWPEVFFIALASNAGAITAMLESLSFGQQKACD